MCGYISTSALNLFSGERFRTGSCAMLFSRGRKRRNEQLGKTYKARLPLTNGLRIVRELLPQTLAR